MTRSSFANSPDSPFTALAEHLAGLRRAARLTQRALAQAASISRGTVQRAESGAAAPSPAVLDAYLRACRASAPDQTRARLLRNRGRTERRGRLRSLNAPKPALIHSEDDLGAALAAEYERAGAPSLRELSRRVPHRPPLPPTTAWRIVHRKGLPASLEQLVTYLTACGVSPAQQRLYAEAYSRFAAVRGVRVTPAPPPRMAHYTDKISPQFRNLLDSMSADDVETALTIGVTQVVAQHVRRNGAALPAGVDPVFFTYDLLFAEDDEFYTRYPEGDAQLFQRRHPPEAALRPRLPDNGLRRLSSPDTLHARVSKPPPPAPNIPRTHRVQ
ncbi:helix-turn-helix domain-containing protein [Streptomyces sp. SID7499]|uniref:Helix-turn-helix domain-containing protein n=1 Tax=Streptomyces sp. SID7499 TaxID=2706086 RepID=A0A6G3XSE5_9ACTN|nr:helix-turn-helix domain-containing protein [Streptomyces sp. SID7499]